MLVVQNRRNPARIRNAIADLVADGPRAIKVAAAYTTNSGSMMLLDALLRAVGEDTFATVPKTLVTSFDYGITEPQALRRWLSLGNATVRVTSAEAVSAGRTTPSEAFHPKMYAFDLGDETTNLLVASANLTGRGFTVNTEAGWSQRCVPTPEVDRAFDLVATGTQPLTNALIDTYEDIRGSRQPSSGVPDDGQPVAPFAAADEHELPLFREAVETEQIDLGAFDVMWVEVEALQGGSSNQLELPRRGHRFFDLSFVDYDEPHNATIGFPTLRLGSSVWADRPLTWHGNNRMERVQSADPSSRRTGLLQHRRHVPTPSRRLFRARHASAGLGSRPRLGARRQGGRYVVPPRCPCDHAPCRVALTDDLRRA